MEVTLHRHVGVNMITQQDVDLGQSRIFVDGRHVGYVGDQPNAPVCLVFQEPPAVRDAIEAYLTQSRGAAPAINAPPPVEQVIERKRAG